jgi:hypothetical protein
MAPWTEFSQETIWPVLSSLSSITGQDGAHTRQRDRKGITYGNLERFSLACKVA